MGEAPERIWADGNEDWDTGSWGLDKEFDNDVEYVRTDLVQATVAAALQDAVQLCRQFAEIWSADKKTPDGRRWMALR
jgi:hypothetical protein